MVEKFTQRPERLNHQWLLTMHDCYGQPNGRPGSIRGPPKLTCSINLNPSCKNIPYQDSDDLITPSRIAQNHRAPSHPLHAALLRQQLQKEDNTLHSSLQEMQMKNKNPH